MLYVKDKFKVPYLTLVLMVTVVVIDQLSKNWALKALKVSPKHFIGFISFRLEFNSGAAFGIGTGSTLIVVLLSSIIAIALLVVAFGTRNRVYQVSLGLIVGGAIGNLADRAFRFDHKYVVDFIYTSFWPTFNLADSSITIGVVTAIIYSLFKKESRPDLGKTPQEDSNAQSDI